MSVSLRLLQGGKVSLVQMMIELHTRNHDLIFSLGRSCKNAWNLRSYFNIKRAYPFDWWITPSLSLMNMINSGFRFHVSPDDLVITPPLLDGSKSVYNRKLHILHHHDFPRQKDQVPIVTKDGIEQVNAKYTALFARLHADIADARAPLAVVYGNYPGWTEDVTGADLMNWRLNREISLETSVYGIRERLGAKVQVAVIHIGAENLIHLLGGTYIARPDLGIREPAGSVPSYAEPVHVFRECYRELGLAPG